MAILLHKLGALGVLNLDGVQARYEHPEEILDDIVHASDREVTQLLQKIYTHPIDDNLVAKRVEEVKKAGAICAISLIPANAKHLYDC